MRHIYAVSLAAILIFCTFAYLGYRNRVRPAVHKRLMLFATFPLLEAAFDRWPVFDPYPLPLVHVICFVPLVLLVMGYDWWSTGRVQRVTILAALSLLTAQQAPHLLSQTGAWQKFALWVQLHMPSVS